MAEHESSNWGEVKPRGWRGPADKGKVIRTLDGRLSVEDDDWKAGDGDEVYDRRNCLDL